MAPRYPAPGHGKIKAEESCLLGHKGQGAEDRDSRQVSLHIQDLVLAGSYLIPKN